MDDYMYGFIQNLSLSRDVILKDLKGNDIIVVKCYCNIGNNSLNMTFDIANRNIFDSNLEDCKAQIMEFRKFCEQKAIENGITIF